MTLDSEALLRAVAASPAVVPPTALATVLVLRAGDLERVRAVLGDIEIDDDIATTSFLDARCDGTGAIESATRAAELCAKLGTARIALATGRTSSGHAPAAIRKRAIAMLAACTEGEPIRVDATTAGLVERTFELRRDPAGDVLLDPIRPRVPVAEAPTTTADNASKIARAMRDERELNAGRLFVIGAVGAALLTLNNVVMALSGAPEQLRTLPLYLGWVALSFGRVILGRVRPDTRLALINTVVLIDIPITFIGQYLILQGHPNPLVVAVFTLNSSLVYGGVIYVVASVRLIIGTAVLLAAGTSAFFVLAGQGFLSGIGVFEIASLSAVGVYAQWRTRVLLMRALDEASARLAHAESASREVRALNDELRRQVAERSRALAEALGRLASAPNTSARLAAGDIVAERYLVIRPIGAGGMGEVHEVERTSDGRRLALKVLTGIADPGALARFAREAQVAAELEHPGVVAALDVGVTPLGMLYVVMELVAGSSLAKLRASYGDETWALPILQQVATALAAMHAHGILHRDLKPANILVDNTTVKIADFGLAGAVRDLVGDGDASTQLELTHRHAIMGTPLYMAPELAGGVRHGGPAADVFSLGVVAFELLSCQLPHTTPPIVTPHVPARRLRDLRGDLAGEIVELVDQCLSVDPADRPTSHAFAAAIERLLATAARATKPS